ncbi:hypothetical protein CEXT_379131 [Caerostris extrusa]|uniref:Uncharacterized protein n=1 Tax=Caerostris extrusa TaxID=172846 RepID=A0AAV4Y1T9_CAEEX|nr:hypothetical protein CEXT_379131 [Caerostris extrusa]
MSSIPSTQKATQISVNDMSSIPSTQKATQISENDTSNIPSTQGTALLSISGTSKISSIQASTISSISLVEETGKNVSFIVKRNEPLNLKSLINVVQDKIGTIASLERRNNLDVKDVIIIESNQK